MLHFGEVFSAEIYARGGIVVGRRQRGKEVVKPWVSRGVSFGTFLSLMKEKYEHLRKPKKDTTQGVVFFLELVAGFEPATCSLRVSCSAS